MYLGEGRVPASCSEKSLHATHDALPEGCQEVDAAVFAIRSDEPGACAYALDGPR